MCHYFFRVVSDLIDKAIAVIEAQGAVIDVDIPTGVGVTIVGAFPVKPSTLA